MSLIFCDIFNFFKVFDTIFWPITFPLHLISNLVLNLFFLLKIGESTGPRISKFLLMFNLFLTSWAALKLFSLDVADIIIAIRRLKGGRLFSFLKTSSLIRNFSGLLIIILLF